MVNVSAPGALARAQQIGGRGFDVVLDTSGSGPARPAAFDLCRVGGQVVLLGMGAQRSEVNFVPSIRQEHRVVMSFAYTPLDFRRSLDLGLGGRGKDPLVRAEGPRSGRTLPAEIFRPQFRRPRCLWARSEARWTQGPAVPSKQFGADFCRSSRELALVRKPCCGERRSLGAVRRFQAAGSGNRSTNTGDDDHRAAATIPPRIG